jgi:hypothetical protein
MDSRLVDTAAREARSGKVEGLAGCQKTDVGHAARETESDDAIGHAAR